MVMGESALTVKCWRWKLAQRKKAVIPGNTTEVTDRAGVICSAEVYTSGGIFGVLGIG
jgi:hypothetical protein